MKKRALILCWLVALAHPKGVAAASVLAVDINPAIGLDEHTLVTNGMYGWSFGLTEPATVTGLAWYDQNPAGLSHAHELGLWQYPGGWYLGNTNIALLISLTIPAGTNASLFNGAWWEVDLAAPVTLVAGYYTVAGTYYSENSDVVKYVAGPPWNKNFPTDPRIIVGSAVFTVSGTSFASYDPSAPLFRIPDAASLFYGCDFGPNLLLLPPLPSLQVSATGNQIVLSWPLWATNFVLEMSTVTGPAASWTATTNAAAVLGQSLVATNPMSTPSAFYRLRQP